MLNKVWYVRAIIANYVLELCRGEKRLEVKEMSIVDQPASLVPYPHSTVMKHLYDLHNLPQRTGLDR